MRGKDRRLWSAEDFALAKSLSEAGLTEAEIGKRVGRTPGAVGSKLWNHFAVRRKAHRASVLHGNADPVVETRLLAEREARAEASYRRSIGAQLMGDPPPGWSALDKRQA